jgi:segregation and condensation protein B
LTTEVEDKPELEPELPLGPAAAAPAGSDAEELRQATQTELAQLKEASRFATPERVLQVLEALFFAAEKPLDLPALGDTTQFSEDLLKTGLAELQKLYPPGGVRGVVLVDLGGRWQLRTEPQVGAYVRRMLQVKPMRLTRAALETLAIISYRQPITRPEVEDLRGVDCGAVTKALLERKLIRILGKKDEPGRPLIYGTTREFLELFNLRDLTQLPTLREFQELSEESRKIVEEEAPGVPAVAGLTELAHDPAVAARIAQATAESESALAQLESAIDRAEETTRSAAAVLAPPAPPAPPSAPAVPAEKKE